MKVLSSLISLLFDLAVLCAACGVIYVVIEPDVFYYAMSEANTLLETTTGRVAIGAVALFVVFLFFLRILFAASKGDKTYVIRRDSEGTLSVSGATIRKLIEDIAGGMLPQAVVEALNVKPQNDALRIALKIEVDMANTNLKDYSVELNRKIRNYFSESLGITIDALDIQASAAAGAVVPEPTGLEKPD